MHEDLRKEAKESMEGRRGENDKEQKKLLMTRRGMS